MMNEKGVMSENFTHYTANRRFYYGDKFGILNN